MCRLLRAAATSENPPTRRGVRAPTAISHRDSDELADTPRRRHTECAYYYHAPPVFLRAISTAVVVT